MSKHGIVKAMEEVLAHARGETTLRTVSIKRRVRDAATMDARKLRTARLALALTQAQMAELLGYHAVSYRQIERGAWPVTRRLEKQVAAICALHRTAKLAPRRRAA